MRGRHYGYHEIALPFGGIARIRFNGSDLNRKHCPVPPLFLCKYSYFFSTSSTS